MGVSIWVCDCCCSLGKFVFGLLPLLFSCPREIHPPGSHVRACYFVGNICNSNCIHPCTMYLHACYMTIRQVTCMSHDHQAGHMHVT